jgi:hypothetical protein
MNECLFVCLFQHDCLVIIRYYRMMFYECSPKKCACGDLCNNQRFRRHEFVRELEVFGVSSTTNNHNNNSSNSGSNEYLLCYHWIDIKSWIWFTYQSIITTRSTNYRILW